jgi:hypothetical protein
MIYAYVTAMGGWMRRIFDSDAFNDAYRYEVTYENNYKVAVISNRLKKNTIDLTYKGREYLSEIYSPEGILKAPIQGWVNPLSGLNPVDFNRDGTDNSRRISGLSEGITQTASVWCRPC